MALTVTRTCADCGELTDAALVIFYFGNAPLIGHAHARALCPTCHRTETDQVKRSAEVWILEQLFSRSAA